MADVMEKIAAIELELNQKIEELQARIEELTTQLGEALYTKDMQWTQLLLLQYEVCEIENTTTEYRSKYLKEAEKLENLTHQFSENEYLATQAGELLKRVNQQADTTASLLQHELFGVEEDWEVEMAATVLTVKAVAAVDCVGEMHIQ